MPDIMCSPSQINQVFLNIITNAAHAMGEHGTLILRTDRHDDKHVRVEIQDDGGGIPSDVLPKIFDPFFTTKPIGEGTGMGLSISPRSSGPTVARFSLTPSLVLARRFRSFFRSRSPARRRVGRYAHDSRIAHAKPMHPPYIRKFIHTAKRRHERSRAGAVC